MSHPSLALVAAPGALRYFVVPARPDRAANDDQANPGSDALLRAALRLFAAHGLGAARHAQARAESAFFAADRDAYRWWLAVTRTLDRQLALELAVRMDGDQPGRGSRAEP